MRSFGFVTFKKEDIPEILSMRGIKINKNGFIEKNRKTVKCENCEKPLHHERLGNMLPGSDLLYCDNPACFAHYAQNKLNI